MRVQYKLKFSDYFYFNAAHQFGLVTCQVLFLSIGLLAFLGEYETGGIARGVVAAILAYSACWVLQLLINVFILYSSKNRTLLTDHLVELQPDCFYEENPFSKSFHKWGGIAKIVSRPGFVAVYINAHAAHIIPDRAFTDLTQRNEFLSDARAKLSRPERASGRAA